jgi:threonine aldolase
MPETYLDFRSDTVTQPGAEMRAAMAAAPVGDDVFGEDPTVLRLQEYTAEILGKEAALFVPSGTMSNQIGLRLHCRPGDEMICEAECHLYYYEQAGYAQLSGVAARPVQGVDGVVSLAQLEGLLRPADPHFVRTRLVTLENTHNRGGGKVQPYALVEAICGWARAHGLATHLDGARLFNAAAATGIEARRWAAQFDTVSVCFSKGLGAPVGSALAGPRDLIAEAVRHRKVLGGGMRQAGIIAAGALFAIVHNVGRLAEDHAHARRLADCLRAIPSLRLRPATVDSNMVFFDVEAAWGTAAEFADELQRRGVRMIVVGPQRVRAVTHLDVNSRDVDRAVEVLQAVASRRKSDKLKG